MTYKTLSRILVKLKVEELLREYGFSFEFADLIFMTQHEKRFLFEYSEVLKHGEFDGFRCYGYCQYDGMVKLYGYQNGSSSIEPFEHEEDEEPAEGEYYENLFEVRGKQNENI